MSCLSPAAEVTGGLAELVGQVRPGQVAPTEAVRRAMGVGPLPPGQVTTPITCCYLSQSVMEV